MSTGPDYDPERLDPRLSAFSESSPLISKSQPQDASYSGVLQSKDKGVARPQDLDTSGQATPSLEPNSNGAPTQPPNPPTVQTVKSPRQWRDALWSWYDSELVSLNLENSGSVARDHLASERTFLAYMRTSLAIASSGVALIQLFTVASHEHQNTIRTIRGAAEKFVRPLGSFTIFLGIMVLVIGVSRYFIVQSALTKGKFPAARLAIGFISVAMTALVTVTFSILLAGKLNSEITTP
ncbi:hypothetical protein FA15DRAFT_626000 [Coprinopsis marcescibilis]|uniref:DUF202 domain-containing protein n=1 Tax=Coprinopsis marcescibilis TaxID=230819 RepID=A0A5C3KJA9_COPMA|nr:hypothetical protein FA15DRAFT_626000 [Coprinopsis marcescibilis]